MKKEDKDFKNFKKKISQNLLINILFLSKI